MGVKIKICGLTSVKDALAAADAGADAIGLMFYEGSPRCITPAVAREIARALPPFIAKVGVFVNAAPEQVKALCGECGLDALQFHGEETPEYCAQFLPRKVIKAFRIEGPAALQKLSAYEAFIWLLDSYVPDQRGGTGATFNWKLACEAKESGIPIILAGGLNPENVAQAVHEVWPYGVDVSSGVESAPGKKDPAMIRDFIAAVRSIDTQQF